MLTCREMSEQASEVLEGRVGWRRRLAAQLHTMMCVHCRRYYRQLRLTIDAVGRMRRSAARSDASAVEAIVRALRP